MQFLLRGVLAWDLTEREGALGLVYLCFGVTMLVATPLGGVASDRLPNRRVLLVSQSVLLAGALGMGIVVVTDVVQFWMLLVASVAQGLAFGFYGPARVAFAAKLVGPDQLGNAITPVDAEPQRHSRLRACLRRNARRHRVLRDRRRIPRQRGVLGRAFVQLLRCPDGAVTQQASGRHPFTDIADGVRYVAAFPALRRLLVSSFFVIMFGFNYVAFIPALVKGDLRPRRRLWVGVLMSASALGAVAVALPLARRADGRSRRGS